MSGGRWATLGARCPTARVGGRIVVDSSRPLPPGETSGPWPIPAPASTAGHWRRRVRVVLGLASCAILGWVVLGAGGGLVGAWMAS